MSQSLDAEASAGAAMRDAEAFRTHVLPRLERVSPDDERHGDHLLNPDFRDWVFERAVQPAAVLIPVVERATHLNVIMTKRMDHLKSHSGQIAFPGGKIDETDRDAAAAAVREAHEEIDMQPQFAQVLGALPDYFTGSGYRISPILALVDPAARLRANPEEVDYVFEVPLAYLMDPANHRQGSREFSGKQRYFYEMPYERHYIWGVTAGIIAMMQARLFA